MVDGLDSQSMLVSGWMDGWVAFPPLQYSLGIVGFGFGFGFGFGPDESDTPAFCP